MKRMRIFPCAIGAAALLGLPEITEAQTTTVTTAEPAASTVVTRSTTTRAGRIGSMSPDMLMLEHASGTEPITYSRTSRTVYVDETGAVVPVESVRVGTPVTVHYTEGPDNLIANRVVVQRQAVRAPAVVERPVRVEKRTTTTTTTEEPKKKVIVEDEDDDD